MRTLKNHLQSCLQKKEVDSNVVKTDDALAKGNLQNVPNVLSFPFIKHHDQSDYGAACLGMVCKYYKMPIGSNRLRDMANVSRYRTMKSKQLCTISVVIATPHIRRFAKSSNSAICS